MRTILLTILIGVLGMQSARAADADYVAGNGVLTLGVIGDSISDEYTSPQGGPLLGYEGYEWGGVLVQLRNVSFGAFSEMLTPFQQTVGYSYNHALKGQAVAPRGVLFTSPFERYVFNTFDAFLVYPSPIGDSGQRFQQQARALAWNFARHEIDAAVIQGGANDLFLFDAAGESYDDPEAVLALKRRVVQGFRKALNTNVDGGQPGQKLADQKIVVATLPVFGGPAQVAAITEINQAIEAVAARNGVPTFSMQRTLLTRTDFARPDAPVRIGRFELPIGSVASSDDLVPPDDPRAVDPAQCGFSNGNGSLPFGTPGCPTVQYQLNITQDDFVHATTITSAFSANDVIRALKQNYGIQLPWITDREILELALGEYP